MGKVKMIFNTNTWNRIRYTLYLPIYDLIAGVFAKRRQQSIAKLTVDKDAKILIVGAGTGLDLPYLKNYHNITAIDLTPGMLEMLRWRARRLGMEVEAKVMDGQKLDLPDKRFDAVILHLILAVIPDPVRCLQEVERVLKPGGEVVIFDKFLPDEAEETILRKTVNIFTSIVATSISRKLGHLLAATNFTKVVDEKASLGGLFRIVQLEKGKEG